MSRGHAAGAHNRMHGTICCAKQQLMSALLSPSVTPEAERLLVTALSAVDAAEKEVYNRRLNPDGTIWERKK